MAWTFTTWKTLTGTGGKTAKILIIAGSIAAGALPWFLRDPAFYFTMRDEAEIVGRAGEQELAMVDGVEDEYTPNPLNGYWHGYFASTNGGFETNAIDRYAQHKLWTGLEQSQDAHFNLTPSPATARRWVDLWNENGVEAYDQQEPFSPLNIGGAAIDARYAINRTWWTNYIFNGATWYPATNRNYIQASDLRAVGRAFTAARWTIEGGDEDAIANSNGITSASISWYASATNSHTTPFQTIAAAAYSALQSATPDGGASPYTGAQLLEAIPHFQIDYHYIWMTRYESATTDSPRFRRVTLREYVSGYMLPAVTIGTNCTAYGIGGREAPNSYASNAEIWHNETGGAAQPYLIAQQCAAPVEGLRVGGTIARNAWMHINPVTAWDGRMDDEPVLLYANYPFPPATNTAVSDGQYFGWQSISTNYAFLIDWRFSHLTNRAAFWP